MLKWFIIGTLLYYAILLWRYRDSLGTWFTGGKREPEQPESKPTVKMDKEDCIVGKPLPDGTNEDKRRHLRTPFKRG